MTKPQDVTTIEDTNDDALALSKETIEDLDAPDSEVDAVQGGGTTGGGSGALYTRDC